MEMLKGRLGIARGCFTGALVLVVAAHFLPAWWVRSVTLVGLWDEMGNDLKRIMGGSWSVDRFVALGSVFAVMGTMLVLPFVAGLLARARPLLWVMRMLATMFTGWFCVLIFRRASHFNPEREHHQSFGTPTLQDLAWIGPGMWCVIGALCLVVVGLWWIPGRRVEIADLMRGAVLPPDERDEIGGR
ncbi:MAG: hypothetical protein QM755_03105 [Luteolibacter sp.]